MNNKLFKILFRIPFTLYFIGKVQLGNKFYYSLFTKQFNGNYYWHRIN
jgi:hypothetical protein